MAKGSGLGMLLAVQGIDISNDTGQIDAAEITRELLDVTGIDKSAHERIPGRYTSRLGFTGFFNDNAAANRAGAAGSTFFQLSSLPTTDVIMMALLSSVIGDDGCGLRAKQVGYGWNRGADGSLGLSAEGQANDDFLNWGLSLTAGKRTDTTPTSGAGVDFLVGSTTFGLVAYLEVFAFAGTSVTVAIQESSDNGGGDPFAAVTGGAFTAASAVGAQRIETNLTQTVERYLRAVTTGTFSNAVFAVVAKRYAAANAER